MKRIIKNVLYVISLIRFIPHLIIYKVHPKRELLKDDRNNWIKVIKHDDAFNMKNFFWLLNRLPEYRSVFYWRAGKVSHLFKILARPQQLLFINMPTDRVGSGLVMQHGYSTIIEAIKIGKNCQIWHNVTIGTNISNSGNKATIGDNVKICTGAMVLGNIKIGNNVTIGAATIVLKNIPDNCTVVGNPAMIVKISGERVNIPL